MRCALVGLLAPGAVLREKHRPQHEAPGSPSITLTRGAHVGKGHSPAKAIKPTPCTCFGKDNQTEPAGPRGHDAEQG